MVVARQWGRVALKGGEGILDRECEGLLENKEKEKWGGGIVRVGAGEKE